MWTGVAARALFNGPTITVGGKGYIAYPTSLSGVSLIVEHSSGQLAGTGRPMAIGDYYTALTLGWSTPAATRSLSTGNARYSFGTRYAFVKTGAIESGTAAVSGPVASAGVDNGPTYTDPAYLHSVHISGSAMFTVPTCAMPNVTVDMGRHMESDFPSVGSRRGFKGSYSDVDIDLSNCYADADSISYSLRPLNGAVAGMKGMMYLAPSSTARGIGLRMTDRSGNPVTFNSKSRVNVAIGARHILLRASIERTGPASFGAGSIAGYVEFTISYV